MLVITREADPSMACSDERAIMQRISAQAPIRRGLGGFGIAKPSRRNKMSRDKGFTMESEPLSARAWHGMLGGGGWHGCSKRLLESRLNEMSGAGLCGFPQS